MEKKAGTTNLREIHDKKGRTGVDKKSEIYGSVEFYDIPHRIHKSENQNA